MEGDAEFVGYSIGLDERTLQLLELPSGEVSSISLDHIVAISDDKPFAELSPDEQETVNRRTSSFKRTCQAWLVSNWPAVYEARGDSNGHSRHRTTRRPVPIDGSTPDGGK